MIKLFEQVRSCSLCKETLPLGPRPIIRGSPQARILIIGQAPGTKAHESGVPWDDASGTRLRDWLQVSAETFYDEQLFAIMPMGLCYPGRLEKGGDKPPSPKCTPKWHGPLRDHFQNVQLTLLVGSYAQAYYLGEKRHKTMTETVLHWQDYVNEGFFPLPHPSWRVANFLKRNPWFEDACLSDLRARVHALI